MPVMATAHDLLVDGGQTQPPPCYEEENDDRVGVDHRLSVVLTEYSIHAGVTGEIR
jgi:hypothetical protein